MMSKLHSRRGKQICAVVLLVSLAGTGVMAELAPSAAHQAFTKENDVAMEEMMRNMHVQSSGNVDRDFIAMMIPHHRGAIDMARAQLRHGQSEELKRLSREIIAKQQEEVAAMHRMYAALGGTAGTTTTGPGTPPAEHSAGNHVH